MSANMPDNNHLIVQNDEAGLRLDRWFKLHFPGLGFSALNKLLRTGQIRLDGGRAKSSSRLSTGQSIRIPPLALMQQTKSAPALKNITDEKNTRNALQQMMLYEDDTLMVLNKPYGLAVQGGSGLQHHLDAMLESYRSKSGQKPRLVHRLDRETSGILVVAKSRKAASALTASFRARNTRKIYWALVYGALREKQGRISNYIARGEDGMSEKMEIVPHGSEGAQHAQSMYNVIETIGQKLTWVSLRPVSGRTHQLRIHMAHIGHPILGCSKYFNIENYQFPGGIQNRLHLMARRIIIPHPDGDMLDVSAPLPHHMQQSWNLLGLDAERYDALPKGEII